MGWCSPGEFLTPLLLFRVNASRNDSEVFLQLRQPRDELVDLLFDIFVFLGHHKIAGGSGIERPYFVMFDECVDPAQSRLEWREPIRRFLRDI